MISSVLIYCWNIYQILKRFDKDQFYVLWTKYNAYKTETKQHQKQEIKWIISKMKEKKIWLVIKNTETHIRADANCAWDNFCCCCCWWCSSKCSYSIDVYFLNKKIFKQLISDHSQEAGFQIQKTHNRYYDLNGWNWFNGSQNIH